MEITKIIRKICKDFKPYVAGNSINAIKREFGLESVIKLASNENPLGASKKALEAIKSNLENIFFYPDSNSYYLKKALSEAYNLPIKNIFTSAGGDEIIELIAKLMDSKVIVVPMKRGLTYDLMALLKMCTQKTKVIFVTNPNNPTGTYNTKSELLEFLGQLPLNNKFGIKPLVVLDEAYFEYALLEKDYPNGLDFLKENPNLIVFRTFSKIYGLAGLRVGYGFANEGIVDYIERIRPPFNVNFLAQVAAAAAILDKEQVEKSQRGTSEVGISRRI